MDAGSLLWLLFVLAVSGLIVGAVGRVLVPGPTPIGILGTIGAGIAGSFLAGIVGRLLFGPALTPGWAFVLAVLGAALVVALVSGRGRRSYYYDREPVAVYDRGYDDRVIVDDDRPRPFGLRRRRRRFF